MPLRQEQADLIEELLAGDAWEILAADLMERLSNKERTLRSGRLTHDDYLRACESIRELEYLFARPLQLVNEARMGER